MTQTGTQVVVRPDNSVGTKMTEIRSPGRGEVLVETVSTLISAGTELGTQEQGRTGDFTPGYSNTGRIAEIGERGGRL